MLVKIKPHSSFNKFFDKSEYIADIKTYNDILFYLNGMHKRFINYLRLQKAQGVEESFVFLDKNLKIINPDELRMKIARKDDVIHIVPAIIGGGGKRGGILAVLAIAMFVFLPIAASAAAAGAAAPVGASVAAAGGVGGGLAAAAGGGLGGFFQNLLVNIGLALLSSLFATKPSEENTRQNDMFGSLTNTTSSGIPIALNYGMVRVAGQMVSGYVLSMGHSKTQQMNIYGEIMASTTTPARLQEFDRSRFLSGFNSF